MYDVFKCARVHELDAAQLPVQRPDAVHGRRHREPLTATFPQPNPATWQPLDLGYQRKDTGGSFEWQRYSPWYFRVDGNQVKQSGTKVGAGSNGTSPGNGFADLPLPVEYRPTTSPARSATPRGR